MKKFLIVVAVVVILVLIGLHPEAAAEIVHRVTHAYRSHK